VTCEFWLGSGAVRVFADQVAQDGSSADRCRAGAGHGGAQLPNRPRHTRDFSQVPDQGSCRPVHRPLRRRVHGGRYRDSCQPTAGAQSETFGFTLHLDALIRLAAPGQERPPAHQAAYPDHACHRGPVPGLRPLTARLGIDRRRERRVPAVPRYRPLQPLGFRLQFRDSRCLLRDHHIPFRARRHPAGGSPPWSQTTMISTTPA
jgi:hypothetical protein